MPSYHFTLILDGVPNYVDSPRENEAAERAIYEALASDNRPDFLMGCSQCVYSIEFDREAASLEAAIRSAVVPVNAAWPGVRVLRVELAGEPGGWASATAPHGEGGIA